MRNIKINGRTPEEIKKGLKCKDCYKCPYYHLRSQNCSEAVRDNALEYMQLLENQIVELKNKVFRLEADLPDWLK